MAEQTKPRDTRSESRFVFDVPLRVLGVDERNTVFGEETHSRNVSRRGVCFTTKNRINPGSAVSIRSFDKSKWSAAAVFQIRWVGDNHGEYLHGALLKDDGDWEMILNSVGLTSI